MLGALLSTLFVSMAASPAVSQWRIVPEVRVVGGDESDLVIDPGLTRAVVPGGLFFELTPGISASRWMGRAGLVDVGTFATIQRFLNDESRRLYAQTVWGDVFRDLGHGVRGRFSASLNFFDDSERDTVRRVGLGGELGVRVTRSRWNAELWVGGRDRRYPNIDVQESGGQVATYTEATWSGGAVLAVSPYAGVVARGTGILQTTDSRDPSFDSESWTALGSIDAPLVSRFFTTLSGTYQVRTFTKRAAGVDHDEYWQVGVGLRYSVAPGWVASLRLGYSKYTWPEGGDQGAHRLAVGIHYTWGRPSLPPTLRIDAGVSTLASGGSIQERDPQGSVRFRIHVPEAQVVGVAGTFNGWNAEATPLRSIGGGWWEALVDLVPGVYEYVYVVDGQMRTPPEATITVDDGFGGRNGILEVLPGDV